MKTEDLPPDHRTDVRSGTMALAIALFAIIVVLMGVDVADDYRDGVEPPHLMIEAGIMVAALVGLVALVRQLSHAHRRAEQLRVDLDAARREAQRFRAEAHEALRGLGEAIDRQFTRWSLTAAEREIGLLVLKGLSHKEIAGARSTTETTIRQQALAVYRKSGLRSRAELSAFFLEDLLLPVGQQGRLESTLVPGRSA
jgi:DNA-binding CsgD family transcriptional regulator